MIIGLIIGRIGVLVKKFISNNMKEFCDLVKKEWFRLGLDRTWYYFIPLVIAILLYPIYG